MLLVFDLFSLLLLATTHMVPQLLHALPSSPPTIPALPESSATAAACPLDLPDDLVAAISASCMDSSSTSSPSSHRRRCCPALAVSLYAAHADAILAAPPVAAGAHDLPVLPDDSETCAAAADAALRARGLVLPRPNETCDATYCYCGVRLQPLRCPGGFVASGAGGRWVPAREETARLLETECANRGLDWCGRCLETLYQNPGTVSDGIAGFFNLELRSDDDGGRGNASTARKPGRERECQLMGLTWLLAQNRTRYLHTAALILRAFMMAPPPTDNDGDDDVGPTSCSVPGAGGNDDDIPLPVDSKHWPSSGGATGTLRLVITELISAGTLYMVIVLLFSSFHHLLF